MRYARTGIRIRAMAIALAVLAHTALLWLFIVGGRETRTEPVPQSKLISVWLDLPAPPPPDAALLPPVRPVTSTSSTRSSAGHIAEPPITVRKSNTPDSLETRATGAAGAAGIDLERELSVVGHSALTAPPAASFSAPPKTARQPCAKRKSSMEWNGKQDRRVGMAGPLPYVRLGKRCAVGLGFFGCALDDLPEANSHLLDDMKAADYTGDSVPDPDRCD
ncbi:MAG: hypothetical protein ABI616_00735 [Pseudomonadota bacterium]